MYPIWAWPHLLGLDAPVVAMCWQLLVSRYLQPIPHRYTLALGLTVWTIYLADRLLDTRRAPAASEGLRHQFSRQFRALLAALILMNLAVLPFLGPLPIRAAIPIVSALAIYFITVHAFRARWPKELAVAVIFALGVALPIHPFPFLLDFAFLCFWNCTAIEYWERGLADLHPIPAWLAQRLVGSALAAAAVCVVCAPIFNPTIQLTLAFTFLLCALLASLARRMPQLTTRVVADLILLTPLLAL